MSTQTQDLTLSCSFYRTPADKYGMREPWICSHLLRRAITLPTDNKKLRIVLSRQRPDNKDWYTFSQAGKIGDIRVSLCSALTNWLANNWRHGYRYGHVEYRS